MTFNNRLRSKNDLFNNVFNYQMIKYPITQNPLKIQKFREQSALTLIKLYRHFLHGNKNFFIEYEFHLKRI